MSKPDAYLSREITGRWGFEPVTAWVARDAWGNWVASARTRRDCERNCRDRGYVPR